MLSRGGGVTGNDDVVGGRFEGGCGRSLEHPASAVFVVQQMICRGQIGESQVRPIPFEFLPQPDGDIAHQHDFGEQSGVVHEVRAGWVAALTGPNPLRMMAGRALQRLGRALVTPVQRFREQARMAGAMRIGEDLALVAHHQETAVGISHFGGVLHFRQFSRNLGHQPAVVPGQLEGRLDNGTDQEMNGDTVFAICSVTKTFTGLLLQDMVERGEMKLDDPVAKYLPQSVRMPTRNGKEITLRQLATHSSGLPKWPDDLNPDLADHPYDDYPAEKFYADLSGYKLTREPGAKFEYSSVGMGLLGHVIALRAATNYESLVVDRICRPLKMDSTRITLPPGLKSRNATGHNDLGYAVYQVAGCPGSDQGPGVWTNDPKKAEPIMPFNRDWRHEAMVGYGELHSTVNDLLKYLSANLGLTPSNLTSLMEKTHAVHFHLTRDIGVGLAWFITPGLQGTKIISHVGDTLGFSSFVGFDKTRRRGVVILINSYDVADACAAGISLLESEWQSDRPKETALDNKIYESYLGQYHLSPDFALGMLMLRQFLRNAPEVLLYVPAGVCLVVLVVLLRRAAGFRKRCIVLGGAALVTGALGLSWR